MGSFFELHLSSVGSATFPPLPGLLPGPWLCSISAKAANVSGDLNVWLFLQWISCRPILNCLQPSLLFLTVSVLIREWIPAVGV